MPFVVSATSGTTVLGAFDPLDAIADLCQRHGLWFHVDVSETWVEGVGWAPLRTRPMLFSCFTGCLGWERSAVSDTQASPGWDPEVHTASFPNPSLQIWGPHHSHKLGSLGREW